MTKGMRVKRKFHLQHGRSNRKQAVPGPKPTVLGVRVLRISRLMALAIRFDQLIREGVVSDQVELAKLGQVSRARLTQIMNLLTLAPDIQEQMLDLPPKPNGREQISERVLRPISGELNWQTQRREWHTLIEVERPNRLIRSASK